MLCLLKCLLFIAACVIRVCSKSSQCCECGLVNKKPGARIVQGTEALPHQYPWMALLTNRKIPFCGGSIITDRYILTAGHCITGFSDENVLILIGAHDSQLDGTYLPVVKMLLYPEYDINFLTGISENDIALVKLEDSLKFTESVKPICLPPPDLNYEYAVVIIAGWGFTKENEGSMSRYLYHTTLRTLSPEECFQQRDQGIDFRGEQHICAYGYASDACQGDSGGPLMYNYSPHKYAIIGVISFGEGCGKIGYAGIYTKISSFVSWIRNNTRDGNCTIA